MNEANRLSAESLYRELHRAWVNGPRDDHCRMPIGIIRDDPERFIWILPAGISSRLSGTGLSVDIGVAGERPDLDWLRDGNYCEIAVPFGGKIWSGTGWAVLKDGMLTWNGRESRQEAE